MDNDELDSPEESDFNTDADDESDERSESHPLVSSDTDDSDIARYLNGSTPSNGTKVEWPIKSNVKENTLPDLTDSEISDGELDLSNDDPNADEPYSFNDIPELIASSCESTSEFSDSDTEDEEEFRDKTFLVSSIANLRRRQGMGIQ